ncbi:hypothetical protein GLYMA_01G083350v4 [Glycine max]|nr:hypothetical protein GLYMA_01G083350v4 [Glycine max]KAG5088316.1 hypothetical protein JHK86_000928 [Glycine max]KAH1162195.1 hypothetical protein GYH30_000898 [Glycine max]
MLLPVLGLAWLRRGYGVEEGVAHNVTRRGSCCAKMGLGYGIEGLCRGVGVKGFSGCVEGLGYLFQSLSSGIDGSSLSISIC